LEGWLRDGGARFDALEVRDDGVLGRGVFARRDIVAGEVAFSVPTKLMLTARAAAEDGVVARVADLLHSWAEDVAPRFLTCLRLCRALLRDCDPFHNYAMSLPSDGPGAASWPAAFRDFLASTSLGPSLAAADAELDQWERLLKRVAESEPALLKPQAAFERPRLNWARGMLQSRQFPGAFGGDEGKGSMCMVPLLDLLNHHGAADVTVRVRGGVL